MGALPDPAPVEPDEDRAPPAPPAAQSGAPDEPTEQSEHDGDTSDDEDDPDQDEDAVESPLSFVRNPGSVPLGDQTVTVADKPTLTLPTKDHRVQSILSGGARSYIVPGTRHQTMTPLTSHTAQARDALVRAGVLSPGKPSSSYRLFVLPKDAARLRVLYDLSPITARVKSPQCHLPRAIDILADPGARYAIKIDLTDGFYHVPVHPALGRQLGVRFPDGTAYCWTVLPMGLASAPGIMQMVTSEAARLVEQNCPGVTARVYLDDFLFSAASPHLLEPVLPLLRQWGFNVNMRKSIVEPTR